MVCVRCAHNELSARRCEDKNQHAETIKGRLFDTAKRNTNLGYRLVGISLMGKNIVVCCDGTGNEISERQQKASTRDMQTAGTASEETTGSYALPVTSTRTKVLLRCLLQTFAGCFRRAPFAITQSIRRVWVTD